MSHVIKNRVSVLFFAGLIAVFAVGAAFAQAPKKPRTTGGERLLEQPSSDKPAADKPATTTAAAKTPDKPSPPKVEKVMITDFDPRGIVKWWGTNWDVGSLFGNMILGPLSRTDGYEVVERERMMELFREQGLSENERFSQAAVTKIGRMLGADLILFGYLTEFSRKKSSKIVYQEIWADISFNARLVDVATGKIVKTAEVSYSSPKKKLVMKEEIEVNPNNPEFVQSLFGKAISESTKMAIAQLTGQGASQPLGPEVGGNNLTAGTNTSSAPAANMPLQAKVADVTGTVITINRGRRHGVKEGQFFVVLKVVKVIKDPDTGQVISQKTEELARLRITKVEDGAAEGALVSGDPGALVFGAELVAADTKK